MGITKPTLIETDIWANTKPGSPEVLKPTQAQTDSGWTYGQKIPYAWRNWIEKTNSEMLVHINQNGIPVWDEFTEYQKGARALLDGNLWRVPNTSLLPNKGQRPDTVPSLYWVKDGSDSFNERGGVSWETGVEYFDGDIVMNDTQGPGMWEMYYCQTNHTSVDFPADILNWTMVDTSTVNVINDLTSGGTTDALSAEQGKILKTEVGDTSTLTTTATELTSGVNELDLEIGDTTTLTTTDKSSLVKSINEIDIEIGDTTTLTTTNNSSLVNSVNELDAEIGDITAFAGGDISTAISVLQDGTTITDIPAGTNDAATDEAKINELLGVLRTAGIIA